MIPHSFNVWKSCITNNCKINLTKEFAQQRLTVYQNSEHQETKKFVALYGETHLQNIIEWYKQI